MGLYKVDLDVQLRHGAAEVEFNSELTVHLDLSATSTVSPGCKSFIRWIIQGMTD